MAQSGAGRLVGSFMDPGDVRSTDDVEFKWGIYSAGERREDWFEHEDRTTVLVLVSGRFHIDLDVGSAVLYEQGDYAIWGPGIETPLAGRGRLGRDHHPLAWLNLGDVRPRRSAGQPTKSLGRANVNVRHGFHRRPLRL